MSLFAIEKAMLDKVCELKYPVIVEYAPFNLDELEPPFIEFIGSPSTITALDKDLNSEFSGLVRLALYDIGTKGKGAMLELQDAAHGMFKPHSEINIKDTKIIIQETTFSDPENDSGLKRVDMNVSYTALVNHVE